MEFKILDLGLIDYSQALVLQDKLFQGVLSGASLSTLVLCEHYPVITLGRSSHAENILKTESELKKRDISIYNVSRGGDVTLHLPGQLVVYPIFNLKLLGRDIHKFLRALEEAVIRLLADYGISGRRIEGLSGVWVGKKKISSLGIAINRWIVTHGLSLNINCDSALFSLIRPCGQNIMITTMEKEAASRQPPAASKKIKGEIIKNFKDIFGG